MNALINTIMMAACICNMLASRPVEGRDYHLTEEGYVVCTVIPCESDMAMEVINSHGLYAWRCVYNIGLQEWVLDHSAEINDIQFTGQGEDTVVEVWLTNGYVKTNLYEYNEWLNEN